MLCPYCQIGGYFGTCTCSVSNNVCPFVRRCNFERKWLPLNSMNGCKLRTEQKEVKVMRAYGYIVRFESKGKLYVEYNGRVIKITNPFDYVPEAVELVQVENELYIKGFEPKIEKEQKEKDDECDKGTEKVNESPKEYENESKETAKEKQFDKRGTLKNKKKDK